MVPQFVPQFIRWTGTATLVLLVSAMLAPGRAEASCGDYVMIGGRHLGHDSSADRLGSEDPAVPRCHGPVCSDNSVPPAAPASKIELTVERWAIPIGIRLAVLPTDHSLLAEAKDFPRDGHGLTILRPPR